MENETGTKLTPVMALARAIARAQDNEESPGTFKEDKDKYLQLARRSIKVLERHGYTVSEKAPD